MITMLKLLLPLASNQKGGFRIFGSKATWALGEKPSRPYASAVLSPIFIR
jgi:hypothetical protein